MLFSVIYFLIAMGLIFIVFKFCRKEKTKKSFLLIILLAILAEVFVFNFSAFHLVGGTYQATELPLGEAQTTALTQTNTGLQASGEKAVLEWKDLQLPVGTLFMDVDFAEEKCLVPVSIDVADSSNTAYRTGCLQGTLISGSERSAYIICRLSGDVSALRMQLTVPAGVTCTVRGVYANTPIPMHLSALRFLLLTLSAFLLYALWNGEGMALPFAENRLPLRKCFAAVTALFLFAAFLCIQYSEHPLLLRDFFSTQGNQLTGELVDAFRHGQVSLLEKPSAELLALNNPYDRSERTAAGVNFLWDHCLYDNNYYSYYGIAPVLLLFLPYNLLTGYYFPTPLAVLLFGGAGIVFMTLLWEAFIRKFFPQLPTRLVLLGLPIMQLSSGIWLCFCSPLFYEIAQSAGFFFVVSGAYFLLTSNVLGDGRIALPRVALSTVFLSLAVLSRPTTAVYCAVALLPLVFGFFKVRRESPIKKRTVGYILCATVFFALFGGAQMLYNYARFDSFLDFGIQYSLTINDFTAAQYHTRFVTIGVINYLFTVPKIQVDFPYFASNYQKMQPNGYYFVANSYAIGLVFRALPVLSLLALPKALRTMDTPVRKRALLLLAALSLAAPAVILFSIWESGYGARYCVDFSWQILLGALYVAFTLYQHSTNKTMRRMADGAILLSAVLSLSTNFAWTYEYLTNVAKNASHIRIFALLEQFMDFWK